MTELRSNGVPGVPLCFYTDAMLFERCAPLRRILSLSRISLLLATVLLAAQHLTAQHDVEIRGVPADAPFAVTAWVDATRLVIDLELNDDWHCYASDIGGGQPLSLEFTGDSAVRAVGKLRLPRDRAGELHGRVRIEQWIRAKVGDTFRAKLDFMVCDPMQCLPPIELTLRGKISPLRVLLVTSSSDAYAERVRSFLSERQFAVTSVLYDQVDAKTCDAHDVVLASSKLFREDGKGGRKARSFPKTESPIVAVGFLGTQLIENHGIAMTSGYI